MRDVRRLICPYPPNTRVDTVLQSLGDEFVYEGIHNAVSTEDAEEDSEDSDKELPEHAESDALADADKGDVAPQLRDTAPPAP